jgi:hypothetical protein
LLVSKSDGAGVLFDTQIDYVLQADVVRHEIARQEIRRSEPMLARETMELPDCCSGSHSFSSNASLRQISSSQRLASIRTRLSIVASSIAPTLSTRNVDRRACRRSIPCRAVACAFGDSRTAAGRGGASAAATRDRHVDSGHPAPMPMDGGDG